MSLIKLCQAILLLRFIVGACRIGLTYHRLVTHNKNDIDSSLLVPIIKSDIKTDLRSEGLAKRHNDVINTLWKIPKGDK